MHKYAFLHTPGAGAPGVLLYPQGPGRGRRSPLGLCQYSIIDLRARVRAKRPFTPSTVWSKRTHSPGGLLKAPRGIGPDRSNGLLSVRSIGSFTRTVPIGTVRGIGPLDLMGLGIYIIIYYKTVLG